MPSNFTSFLTIFQSYQDDRRVIMEAVRTERFPPLACLKPRTTRKASQHLSGFLLSADLLI